LGIKIKLWAARCREVMNFAINCSRCGGWYLSEQRDVLGLISVLFRVVEEEVLQLSGDLVCSDRGAPDEVLIIIVFADT
jgi:hypothetical protein